MNRQARPHYSAMWYWRRFPIEAKLLCVFVVANTALSILAFTLHWV